MGRAAGQRARNGLLPPALLVRGAAAAAAALRLAAGRRVTLLSAPGAAGWLGAEGWRALLAQAAATVPAAPFDDLLCCGDAPGRALAALRAGCRALVLEGAVPAFGAVRDAAAEIGAVVLPARPPALDLAGLNLAKPGAAAVVRRWLAAHPDDSTPRPG